MNIPENFPLKYNKLDNANSPYFISIDTGTRNIAFAVFKVDFISRTFTIAEIVYLRRELERDCPTEHEKMMYINNYAWELFLKYKPFIIVFELIALNSVPDSKLKGVLAAQNVTGQLILSAGALGIPYKSLPPTQIKYTTANYSKASKTRIQEAVDKLLKHSQPLVLKVNHVADAIAIGYTYLKTVF